MVILSGITQRRLQQWKNTRIAFSGTISATTQYAPLWFWQFLAGRIAEVNESPDISPQQQHNMAQMIKKNPIRAFNSESFRAFLFLNQGKKIIIVFYEFVIL